MLIGLLIQHHQAVKAEANDLRVELPSYHQAQDEAFASQSQMEGENERFRVELESLDPDRAELCKQGASSAHEMQGRMSSLKVQMQQVEAIELEVTSSKGLLEAGAGTS